ncbi:uncharacterized protein BX663DRAFT_491539 [Cokeromyces recurvatus]|uniref:uncharacterized protein n=1 Tax=Cokeromyces recurvatus TaxID=90255 RepID=UPI00221EE378|nr:uncharacterized protein BX663DRAFT_491539 [Cokeromyces recurvatus]KAI7907639.1 hypothetical protein BX663DRAFT_491539 [Cokeromyces recurvatus]
MITQDQFLPLTFSKINDDATGSTVFIHQFIKEAMQILIHANNMFSKDVHDLDSDNDKETVTWQLNLTPTMMTLDTNIMTLSGLEKVLKLIHINIKPQPPNLRQRENVIINSDQYDIPLFRYMLQPILQLSTVISIPNFEQFAQYNSMQLMRYCIQCFIDCGDSFFMDIPTLIANTDMILSQPDAVEEHKVEALLVFSICALTIRHTTIHHRGDKSVADAFMYTFYMKARNLLQDVFDVHHILILQSIFILSLFPQGHLHLYSSSRIESPLLTMAIRMALSMDLHKIDDSQYDKESDQKEKLRRFAWMLLCADYHAHHNRSGHTGTIDVTDWHVNFPRLLPDEGKIERRIELFSQYCRIIMIRKMELFRTSYMISLQSSEAIQANLDSQLFEAYFNTPDRFKLDLDPTLLCSKSDLERLLLNELYCQTKIFAQLPFLPKHYFETYLSEEDAIRCSDLNDIYKRIIIHQTNTATKQIFVQQQTASILQKSEGSSLIKSDELEYHCLVELLTVINDYTLILELLTAIDTIGCHHSPVYGAMLTMHLYLIIKRSCQNSEIQTVCQINLNRTQHILRQASLFYTDPAILYLQTMLIRHNIITEEAITICTLNQKPHEIIRSLRTKYRKNKNNSVSISYL